MSTEDEILSICFMATDRNEASVRTFRAVLVDENLNLPSAQGGSNLTLPSAQGGSLPGVPAEFAALVARIAIESQRREQAAEEALSSLQDRDLSVVGYYSVTLSLILWDPVFRFGLYAVVPWGALFSLGFMAMALFIASVLQKKWILNKRWASVVMATFIVYIFFLSNLDASNSTVLDVFGALVILLLAACAIHLLTKIFAPQVFSLRKNVGKTAYVQVGLTVLSTLTFAYCVGRFNYAFLTCENFVTAGMKEPNNCEHS